MKCRFQFVAPHATKAGWNNYRCRRAWCVHHKKLVANPRGPDFIKSACTAWPLPHETREWLAIFSAALGLSQAAAIVAYIRWRARGSKLDELPPSVPRPDIAAIPAPDFGPGTELAKIFSSLGIEKNPECQCADLLNEMNRLGSEGCERQRCQILLKLQTAYDEASVLTKLQAGTLALAKGLPCSLDGLFGEAIRRAKVPL